MKKTESTADVVDSLRSEWAGIFDENSPDWEEILKDEKDTSHLQILLQSQYL